MEDLKVSFENVSYLKDVSEYYYFGTNYIGFTAI